MKAMEERKVATVDDVKKELSALKLNRSELGEILCRINNALVSLDNQIKKSYQEGMDNAWETAKRLFLSKYDIENALSDNELEEIFGTRDLAEVARKPLQTIMEKIFEWEESKVIHVGDVVETYSGDVAVVTSINGNTFSGYSRRSGGIYNCQSLNIWHKTGEHIDLGIKSIIELR